MARPNFQEITTGKDFNRWYWLKEEMVDICKRLNLPYTGRKFEIRDRIMFALDNEGRIRPELPGEGPTSKFNWATENLTIATKITDNVSFGPNFRRFMKSRLGDRFICDSDFMDWVKANEGKTLAAAIEKWEELESRNNDPMFRRDIAPNNMFNQYVRDFMDDNPKKSLKEARKCWLLKKELPTENGFIRYSESDLQLDG